MAFDPNNLNELKDMIVNAPDSTNQYSPEDIQENTIVAAITTIPCVFWLPLVVNTNSGFAKFYANQSLILTIFCVVAVILNKTVGRILWIIPLLGHFLSTLFGVALFLIGAGSWLFLLVNAIQGKAKELPLIGNLLHPFT